MAKKIIIVGSGVAGSMAALLAKASLADSEVKIIGREKTTYVRCSTPFAVCGQNRLEDLIKSRKMFEDAGVAFIQEEVLSVDAEGKKVKVSSGEEMIFDSLILATGADPVRPPIPGVDKENIFTVRNAEDTEAIIQAVKQSKNAVVVGGGAIGLEMAVALETLGLKVAIIEAQSELMQKVLDSEFRQAITQKLKEHGIQILTGTKVEEFLGSEKVKQVKAGGQIIPADLVILAVGVKSNTKLAQDAGIKTSWAGIETNEFMETSSAGIFAAGDCATFYSNIFGQDVPTRTAPRAVIEGKVAGINAALGKVVGVNPFQACFTTKIYELGISVAGLSEDLAARNNIKVIVGKAKSLTKYDSFKTAKPIEVKVLFNEDRKIVGGAIKGEEDIAQRLNLLSLAIQEGITVEALARMDYTASPAFTPLPFAEPLVMAAEDALKKF